MLFKGGERRCCMYEVLLSNVERYSGFVPRVQAILFNLVEAYMVHWEKRTFCIETDNGHAIPLIAIIISLQNFCGGRVFALEVFKLVMFVIELKFIVVGACDGHFNNII